MPSSAARSLAAALLLGAALAAPALAAPRVEERSVAELQADMTAGRTSSEALVRAYTDRIEKIDRRGPALHSVIAVNPRAVEDAKRLDAERKAGRIRGPLHGVPVLIKDNIEDDSGLPTTAGSLALVGNANGRDAPMVARLKAAGAVILGKTNLSEWANIRSTQSISGWSGVGGLVKNPYALDRNSCGSSSGTGSAIAASLGAVGIGTETDGSVTCPSSINGLAGLKPTVGLVSRTYVVPISHSQDTPGPMGRSVADIAALLTGMAGSDPADPQTAEADAHKTDYLAALSGASLKGKRLGVLKYATERRRDHAKLWDETLAALRAAGAEIVEIKDRPPREIGPQERQVLMYELKADLNAYLATTDARRTPTRTLADLIAFNVRTPRELALFNQDQFETAQKLKGLDDPDYVKARAGSLKGAKDAIDKYLAETKVDALIWPSPGPAWQSDAAGGDHYSGEGAGNLAAISGYPHLTVPAGYVRGLPVGLSFIGPAWSEAKLLRMGAAFEAATHARRAPRYLPTIEQAPEVAPLLEPAR